MVLGSVNTVKALHDRARRSMCLELRESGEE